MRRTVALLALIGLTSCAFDQTILFDVDPRLAKHVERFYTEAAARGIFLEKENLIVSADTKTEHLGVSRKEGDQRVVLIYEWCIENYSHEKLELLVFHELGHALLGRHHSDHYSIMQESISMGAYEGNPTLRTDLLDELFLNQ